MMNILYMASTAFFLTYGFEWTIKFTASGSRSRAKSYMVEWWDQGIRLAADNQGWVDR